MKFEKQQNVCTIFRIHALNIFPAFGLSHGKYIISVVKRAIQIYHMLLKDVK